MNERTAALQERFRGRAARDLALLERYLAAGDLGAAAVEETVHKLAGTSAIFGFVEVGKAALAIDRIFSDGGRPGREVLQALTTRLAAISLPEAAEMPPGEAAEGAGGRETILVVEDDDLIRSHAERQLRSLGYRVILATDGDALLAELETLPPVDLLFTDLMLPGTADGRALARAMKEVRPDLRVLFTSGRAVSSNGTAPADFLSKPYRRDTLAAMVRQVLDGARRGAAERT